MLVQFSSASGSRKTLADLRSPQPCGPRRTIFKKARAFSLGSGLATNRKNRSSASGSYPAFDPAPVLLDQRLAIDPCRPSVRRLESEDGDLGLSPGRGTNRKNLRTCQRTREVLLLSDFPSRENTRLHRIYFQRDAARPQAGDEKWCRRTRACRWRRALGADFAARVRLRSAWLAAASAAAV